MPDLALRDAEATLQRDGRFAWLLSGRQAWGVSELVEEYEATTGVPISHDTVTRWMKALAAEGGAENYGGTIGWRAQRDALVLFFAAGRHLRREHAG